MPSNRTVLAFDTSAAHCAAALLTDGAIIAARQKEMGRGQAERLIPLLEEVLAIAGKTWADLDTIGVGVGPGNFTGIRIGVAAARGLALSLGIPAIGVSTFETLKFGHSSDVTALVDARQDRMYLERPDATPAGPFDLDQLRQRLATGTGHSFVGHRAEEIAELIGGESRETVYPIAHAIAFVAQGRCEAPMSRPTPLYLKAADAAPPRDPALVILP